MMRVCLIVEGSYPYVTGGVSSWIHTLIQSMPEIEFVIYAIAAQTSQKGKFKYSLPSNLVEVHEVFLDSHVDSKASWGKRYQINEDIKQDLFALVSGTNDVNWPRFFHFIRNTKIQNVTEFISSKDYYDLIEQLATQKYKEVPFTELFWTVGSMLIPLLTILRDDIPKADIYHAVSTGYAGVIGSLAKVLYNKPLILTEHGIYSREREEEIIKASWVKGYFKDLWIGYFYTLSNSIYQISSEVLTLFHRNKEIEIDLGCPEEKISIIPNGIDIQEYEHLHKTWDNKKVRIGAIVRLVPIKDIKMMIQMFGLVEKALPNVELYILGPTEENPEYYEECLLLAQSLQIKNIHFTGMVQVKEYIANMDLLVLTSISEGQPLAILEGFAAKKAFVSTNVGCCQELIKGLHDEYGPAGYVVPVMHYEEMAAHVIKLCQDEKLRIEMGLNGYNRVKNLYKKSSFIENYKMCYLKHTGGEVIGRNRI